MKTSSNNPGSPSSPPDELEVRRRQRIRVDGAEVLETGLQIADGEDEDVTVSPSRRFRNRDLFGIEHRGCRWARRSSRHDPRQVADIRASAGTDDTQLPPRVGGPSPERSTRSPYATPQKSPSFTQPDPVTPTQGRGDGGGPIASQAPATTAKARLDRRRLAATTIPGRRPTATSRPSDRRLLRAAGGHRRRGRGDRRPRSNWHPAVDPRTSARRAAPIAGRLDATDRR